MVFHGYSMELKGSSHGHLALGEVLSEPAIDSLCSPVSYHGREPSGYTGFMAPVDSLPLHGKLWIIEDDTRTHRWTADRLPSFLPAEDVGAICRDSAESIGVLKRQAGAALAHGAGVWWMDLVAVGAFEDPPLWDFMANEFLPACRDRIRQPTKAAPAVAVIIDEESLRTLREDFPGAATAMNELSHQALFLNRDAYERCGAPVGYYLLADLLDGRIPDANVYLLPCCWNMTPARAEQLATWWKNLARGHAVWLYTAGLPPEVDGAGRLVSTLTGIPVVAQPEPPETLSGEGPMEGLRWGSLLSTGPRWHLEPDRSVESLASFPQGAGAAGRRAGKDGEKSATLLAHPSLSWQALGILLELAGVHRWSRDGEAVTFDGRLLSLHGTRDGRSTIHLPGGAAKRIAVKTGETVWIDISKEEGEVS